jgi:sorbitol-6-phosphate 2-dehydrogenase
VLFRSAAKLDAGGFWTREAEAELLRVKLGPEPRGGPGRRPLEGKVALVTGASQGLGRALAERFAIEGASVVLCDINEEGVRKAAEEVSEATGQGAVAVRADVTKLPDMDAAVRAAVEAFGRLDVLISNAGILISGALEDFDVADWRKVIEVNLVGYFVAAKAAAPELIKTKGCLIQINSKSGKKGSFKNSAYAASKFGGIGLTQSLAFELAPLGVRVNAICPGNLLDSPLWVDSLYQQYAERWRISEEEVRKKYEEQVPLGRGCSYEDVANVAVFLASDQAAYMTGQAINVTGGQEMR